MAALVTAGLADWKRSKGISFRGPTVVATADETDLSTPNTALTYETFGVRRISLQVAFANYTSVAVKLQRSMDGGTSWDDLHTALSTSTDSVDVAPEAPLVRLSIAGTLSASADTMTVMLSMEGYNT